MNAQTRRRVFVISVGVVVAAALAYGFLPKPVPVDVAKAARGPLRVTVEEEGRTRVRDRFVLSAPVAGYLRRIELNAGDRVKKASRSPSSSRSAPRSSIPGARPSGRSGLGCQGDP